MCPTHAGFIWEEVKEISRHGMRKYMRNMWNLMDLMRDSLYLFTMLLRIFAYVQQNQEIARVPSVSRLYPSLCLIL